jgi:hypothetical protein
LIWGCVQTLLKIASRSLLACMHIHPKQHVMLNQCLLPVSRRRIARFTVTCVSPGV